MQHLARVKSKSCDAGRTGRSRIEQATTIGDVRDDDGYRIELEIIRTGVGQAHSIHRSTSAILAWTAKYRRVKQSCGARGVPLSLHVLSQLIRKLPEVSL